MYANYVTGGQNVAKVEADFVKLADAFGIVGYRARSPEELRTHLRRAIEKREIALIDVPVGALPSPWPVLRYKPVRGVA